MSGTQPEVRVQIDRNPTEPGTGPKFAKARRANEGVAAEIKKRRQQIHRQHAADQATPAAPGPAAPPDDPPPVREDIETIEFDAPNGMHIEYGPPKGISLIDRIARLYNGRDPTVSEFRLTRILMGVRTIDGKAVPAIVDEITRTALANRIGDEVIDLLMFYDRQHFPALRQSEIPQIKKNLR